MSLESNLDAETKGTDRCTGMPQLCNYGDAFGFYDCASLEALSK